MDASCEPGGSAPKPGPGIRTRLLKGIGAQGFSQVVQIFIRLTEVPLLQGFWDRIWRIGRFLRHMVAIHLSFLCHGL
jgi:hypothetical protein